MKSDLRDFLFFAVCISNIFAWGQWTISRSREKWANDRSEFFKKWMNVYKKELISIAIQIQDARAKRNRKK